MALFVYPRAFALDRTPANGVYLKFFESGTTTPKTVYSDPDMTTPHSVEVTAVNGVFPAIYLTGAYKVVTYDANDSVVRTDDEQVARAGDVQYKGTFTSSTNSSNYPASGSLGDMYQVTEEFQLDATSGSHFLKVDDFILCNKNGATGIDADWEILSGINSRPAQSDWSAKGLIINVASNTTVTVQADYITLVNSAGETKRIGPINDTYDITTDIDIGTEKASTWYPLWIDEDEQLLMCADFSSTADADVENSLSDSAATFQTDGIAAGDVIYQTTDNLVGYVKAVSSETVLTCKDFDGDDYDLFPDGNETYVIHKLSPTGIGNYKANIGAVQNDSGSDLVTLKKTNNISSFNPISVLANGSETNNTLVSLITAVPVTAKTVLMFSNINVADGSNGVGYISRDGTEEIQILNKRANATSEANDVRNSNFWIDLQNTVSLWYKTASGAADMDISIGGFTT
jgi:hypothetical protein